MVAEQSSNRRCDLPVFPTLQLAWSQQDIISRQCLIMVSSLSTSELNLMFRRCCFRETLKPWYCSCAVWRTFLYPWPYSHIIRACSPVSWDVSIGTPGRSCSKEMKAVVWSAGQACPNKTRGQTTLSKLAIASWRVELKVVDTGWREKPGTKRNGASPFAESFGCFDIQKHGLFALLSYVRIVFRTRLQNKMLWLIWWSRSAERVQLLLPYFEKPWLLYGTSCGKTFGLRGQAWVTGHAHTCTCVRKLQHTYTYHQMFSTCMKTIQPSNLTWQGTNLLRLISF